MGMAAADEVWCNSAFQRQSLLAALPALLGRAPDLSHARFLPAVAERCHVVPVGVDLADIPRFDVLGGAEPDSGVPVAPGVPLVLWNQRWDHDKNPKEVLDALIQLADAGVAFQVALVGENKRVNPREFIEARAYLGERVVAYGFLDRPDYVELLGRADVVVSAAEHEFFGIAVVEAMAAGCVPVLPTRQSYPELVGAWADGALYPAAGLRARLQDVLVDIEGWRARVIGLDEAIRRFDWRTVVHDYDNRLDSLVAGGTSVSWYEDSDRWPADRSLD
jgi:glycosyltransferase involved in cell wall biosynthesis